ncbi:MULTISPECIES: DUF397 domain-containing protein [Actinomadura]|uniref:DUF397 domain-containing protein n=1 Tax=Actinomadura yumaensis TaxID=111807 RepID=A0ABW2CJA4_9ACTN|nr:DUF397 domain-containing protein [Actinomadura sp. J1-007]MWK37220.1 DUF397 domain-containing protein [Actinomadura sp. J1-007]
MSAQWRKSSYSHGAQDSDCVEAAKLPPNIGVRDSKAPGAGHLVLAPETFAELLARLKQDGAKP